MQHDRTQRPGVLLDYLNEAGIPSVIFTPEGGDDVPSSARDFSGLVLLGSPHSVNDKIEWIDKEHALVRHAMASDIPVLGHCFGGQMMAKVLGATVSRNACPNIGWSRLRVTSPARRLFAASEIVAFNWHYETFGIPHGAQRLLIGEYCLNKGFAIGKHLAFQPKNSSWHRQTSPSRCRSGRFRQTVGHPFATAPQLQKSTEKPRHCLLWTVWKCRQLPFLGSMSF